VNSYITKYGVIANNRRTTITNNTCPFKFCRIIAYCIMANDLIAEKASYSAASISNIIRNNIIEYIWITITTINPSTCPITNIIY
jgi:hypothetical protein